MAITDKDPVIQKNGSTSVLGKNALSQQKKQLFLAMIASIGIAVVSLLYKFDPMMSKFTPKCSFYTLTGLYCPGCGAQRSIHALLHGDIWQALHFNPLLVCFLPYIIVGIMINVYSFYTNQPIRWSIYYNRHIIWIIFGILSAFWIMRNLPWYPFNLLAPGSSE